MLLPFLIGIQLLIIFSLNTMTEKRNKHTYSLHMVQWATRPKYRQNCQSIKKKFSKVCMEHYISNKLRRYRKDLPITPKYPYMLTGKSRKVMK